MRKLATLTILAIISFSIAGYSQTGNGKVNGIVIDGNSKIIESATITLLRAKDSSVFKMSVADKTGKFSFDGIGEGKYIVSISAVGHNKGFSEAFEINKANTSVTLKTIELVPVAKSISGVTVVAKKPLIEQKIDRTIVNVDASITN